MNYLKVVILIFTLINISFGYKTDCNSILPISCTFYLTPDEDAYRSTLLRSLNSKLKNIYDLGLDSNESDENKIEEVNKKLQTVLDDNTINEFLENLSGFGKRGYGVRVMLVSKSIYDYLQSDYTTKKPTTVMSMSNIHHMSKNSMV
uniref:Inhibitor I9 domain-containing protein n=1 Tax=Strongyloides papillosus TaxID=174720 RepID=A0A0N5CIP2_STREA